MIRKAKTEGKLASVSARRSKKTLMIQPKQSCAYPLTDTPRRVDVVSGRCKMFYGGRSREMREDEFAVVPGGVEFTLYNPSDIPVFLVERRAPQTAE